MFDIGAQLSRDIGERWARAIGRDRYAELVAALHAILALDNDASDPP